MGTAPAATWPTVRQPNDVAVDEATGRVFVASTAGDQLQLIDPGRLRLLSRRALSPCGR